MDLRNTKIMVNTRKESTFFQELVIELGGCWGHDGKGVELESHDSNKKSNPFRSKLYVGENLQLTYGSCLDSIEYFSKQSNKELKLVQDSKLANKLYKNKIIAKKDNYLIVFA